jgi:predicted transcriptional regulator
MSKRVKEVSKNEVTTSKKQKFVGYKELVDPATGELVPMQIQMVEDRDFNFHKVWLKHLINGLDEITNQKVKVAFWIVENLDKENQIIMTQRQIAEECDISYQTVSRTIKALCKSNFIQKINNGGSYRVNPNVLFKGSHNNRMGIIYDYSKTISEQTKKITESVVEQITLPSEIVEVSSGQEQVYQNSTQAPQLHIANA